MPDHTRAPARTYTDYRWIEPVHVWVDVTGQWTMYKHPGILLGWRRGHDGWEGFVVQASATAPAHGSTPTITATWHDAHHVREA